MGEDLISRKMFRGYRTCMKALAFPLISLTFMIDSTNSYNRIKNTSTLTARTKLYVHQTKTSLTMMRRIFECRFSFWGVCGYGSHNQWPPRMACHTQLISYTHGMRCLVHDWRDEVQRLRTTKSSDSTYLMTQLTTLKEVRFCVCWTSLFRFFCKILSTWRNYCQKCAMCSCTQMYECMAMKGVANAAACIGTAPAREHTIATVSVQARNSISIWPSSNS